MHPQLEPDAGEASPGGPNGRGGRVARLLLRGLALSLVVGILVLLLGPATSLEQSKPGSDKVAHFIAFGLLLWSGGVLFPTVRRLALAAGVVVIGGTTEVLQGFVGRDADLTDFFADAAGVVFTLLVWSIWRGFRPRTARAAPATEP